MAFTQINGMQIQDASISTEDLALNSIDAAVIKDGTIQDAKVVTVSADKITLKDQTNKFAATEVESALVELSAGITKNNTDLSKVINDNYNMLDTLITDGLNTVNQTITINQNSASAQLNSQVSTLNSTITANKTDIEGKLATQATTLNSSMTSKDAVIDARITTEVAGLNSTISANKTDIEDKLTTQIAAVNAAKADKNGNVANDFAVKNVTLAGNILPTVNGTQDIGSPTNRFSTIYVNEAKLSTNTLYIGDTPVLGTSADTIMVKADANQGVTVATKGTGITTVQSEAGVTLSTSGMNADVKVQAAGVGAAVRLTAAREVDIQGPNINLTGAVAVTGATSLQDLTITGNLTVNGTTTTVNTATLSVTDNIVEINKGQVGSGVTAGSAGLKVDRGDAAAYMMVFDEVDDMFKVGMAGQLETIASQNWVNAHMYVHPTSHPATIITEDTTHRFMTDTERGKLSGIEIGAQVNQLAFSNVKVGSAVVAANNITSTIEFIPGSNVSIVADTVNDTITINATAAPYVHPATHPATMITEDATHRFMLDTERTRLSNMKQAITGSSSFAGLFNFNQITLPITMANTAYTVSVMPTANTNCNLGEVWVEKTTTSIKIYNTGTFTGTFDYTILY